MTQHRNRKQLARNRAAATGEPYTLAKRNTEPRIMAWDDENGYIVIYGTHDPVIACDTFAAYYRNDCGFAPGDDYWFDEVTEPGFYIGMKHLWTLPKDDEERLDMFTEPGPGRVPFLLGSYPG